MSSTNRKQTGPKVAASKVTWRRSHGDGFVESHCGRYRITPLYWGCTRPQLYELRYGNQIVASYCSTQREAKEAANRHHQKSA